MDAWRAQALLESARRMALEARRAIEAKYLVDLSTLNSQEPFVAAPATSADEVYDYDLSPPAAVGLSSTTGNTSGIYPNKISDYVANLNSFVQGYAVDRPVSVVSADAKVLTLLGPDQSLASTGVLATGEGSTAQYAWSYYCGTGTTGQWTGIPVQSTPGQVVLGQADHACAAYGTTKPTLARLVFKLDPWGNVNGYGVQGSPNEQFNTRWKRLAINLVGTGIKDCTLAADPGGCYETAWIPYDLSHVGPSYLTDYEGKWHVLGVPIGQVNQAKALVAEESLDPIAHGWSAADVQAVQRVEFSDRPLDGTYQLVLTVAPEVQLAQIQRVQILTETSYWVRQQ